MNKQNFLNAMLVVITMALLCWGIKLHRDIATTQKVLSETREYVVNLSNALKETQGLNIQLFQLGKRVEGVEVWIWDFEDIMFGPSTNKTE